MLDQKASQPSIFFAQASYFRRGYHNVWKFIFNFAQSKACLCAPFIDAKMIAHRGLRDV